MSWISGFETSTLLIGFVMFVVYLYLFLIERKQYILIWAISWGMYSVHCFIKILATWGQWPIHIFRVGEALTAIWSAFFLVLGACMFLNKKLPNFWVIGWIILSIGVMSSIIYQNLYFAIPILFISIIYVWVGVMFFRSKNIQGAGQYLTGSMFILWGVHVSHYPFSIQVEEFVPWGYSIGEIILVMAAFGILLTYFEKTRNDLKTSEQHISMITNNMVDTIIKTDPSGIFEYVSPSIEKLLGYKSEEIKGKSFTNFLHPSDAKMVNEAFEYVTEKGGSIRLEYRCRQKDGQYIWVEAIGNRLLDDRGNLIGGAACIRNIVERKKAEVLREKVEQQTKQLKEAMELDELRTEFFTNISHELRTPLNIILATVQLFDMYYERGEMEAIFKSKMVKHVNIMKQNCYRLLRLINNLIDITKIDTGYFEARIQNHNIVNIVEEITLSISDFIRNRGIKFQFDTETEEKIMACAPDNIERIMLNLLSNAVKYTKPDGEIYVKIYDKQDSIIISVKDTGIGIPQDKFHKVFQRFNQVRESLAKQREGNGIGLSLVKSIVEMHGGKIWVESECGKGSEFRIKLPVHVLDQNEDTHTKQYIPNDRIERMNIEFADIYDMA